MPNTNGNTYSLTAIFPLIDGMTGNTTEAENLRADLADLPRQNDSPFARKRITHFTRFVVIDEFGYNGEPSMPDPLASTYLLWTACFNGDLDTWLTAMWNCARPELKAIFTYCLHYDEYPGKDGFIQYVKRGQITTSFPFADYRYATVEEVLEGLKFKKYFVDFVVENQGVVDAQILKDNFTAWMKRMNRTPSPTPGSVY